MSLSTRIVMFCAALLLAYQPMLWLVQSWSAPGYPSTGPYVFAGVVGLLVYSLTSQRLQPLSRSSQVRGIGLLATTALIRAFAQWADISTLGATVLAVDLYALATLLGLADRRRAVAPFWLALLFCFCLPIEPWLQRLLGAPLQWLSAQGACAVLKLGFAQLQCEGVRLSLQGLDVLVDLPCSGSQLLTQLALLLTLCFTLRPTSAVRSLVSLVFCLALVLSLNALRIALLTVGYIVQPQTGLDLTEPLAHELLGLLVLVMGTLSLLRWVRAQPMLAPRVLASSFQSLPQETLPKSPFRTTAAAAKGFASALAFAALAWVVVGIEASPPDRTPQLPEPYRPWQLAGQTQQPVALSQSEQRYYQTYGGAAAKAAYGPFGLLLVQTGAPIRHLHAPELCLSAMGLRVSFLGTDFQLAPTSVFRVTDPTSGKAWQVRVSYIADDGQVVAHVTDIVWRWLRAPTQRWTMVQRLIPLPKAVQPPSNKVGVPELRQVPAAASAWEQAVLRAYNLSVTQSTQLAYKG